MASVKRRPNRGGKWQARYRDPAGVEHARLFDRKADADHWLDTVRADLVRGTYVDPNAGRQTFRDYATEWQAAQIHHRPGTSSVVASHLKNHILPAFGDRQLASIRPSEVQAWVTLISSKLAPSTVELVYGYAATIFRAAVFDERLKSSPCRGKINRPEKIERKVIPLPTQAVVDIAAAMPKRYRALVVLAAGTGMRQGEAFGLSVSDLDATTGRPTTKVDFLRREIRVRDQLTLVGGVPTRSPLKTRASERTIPAPTVVLDALSAHLSAFPAGETGLLFTDDVGRAIRRNRFNEVWHSATKAAELPLSTHFHELRHFYASLLIHHGSSVKVVQDRLGHKTAIETLDTYGHLWPDSEDQTRAAVDAVLGDLAESAATTARS